MDAFSIQDLRILTAHESATCVTLYMPTHPSGPATQQDAIRLRNLADQACDQLVKGGMRAVEARELVQPARELSLDEPYWRERSSSLAVFFAPGFFRAYRLPDPLEEAVTVNRRFVVRPLIPLLAENRRYFVLAVSQNQVAMFEGSRFHLTELPVPGLPKSREETISREPVDRGMQVHSGTRVGNGKQAAVFHGQGGVRETTKQELSTYLRAIDMAVHQVLREESAPLVLATVDFMVPLYRQVCTYPHLVPEPLSGNPDYLTVHELHEKSWALVAPTIVQARDETLHRYRRMIGSGRTADRVTDVVLNVMRGRVDSLLIDQRARCWGRFDVARQSVVIHDNYEPGDDDLIDLAASETLSHRGRVVSMPHEDMPAGTPMAALMRY